MKDSHLILLLQVINADADVKALQDRGLSFSQIAQLISESIEKGWVIREESRLKLTDPGKRKMREGIDGSRSRTDGGWISPLEEYRIEQWNIYEIYLPPEEESYFKS